MKKVSILGAGKMGSAMARELAVAGLPVTLWNRSGEKLDSFSHDFSNPNLKTELNLNTAVTDADIILLTLTSGRAVEELVLQSELLSKIAAHTIVVDMGTSGVATAKRLSTEFGSRGLKFVDAPVSGSMATIAAHQLLVMASGDSEDIEEITPTLLTFSKNVVNLGAVGNGQAMKLAVNLIVHSLNSAIAESLSVATSAGIELASAYNILEESVVAAPFLKYKRAAFLDPKTPVAMRIDTVVKDLNLISTLSSELGLHLISTPAVSRAYVAAEEGGLGALDMARLIQLFQD